MSATSDQRPATSDLRTANSDLRTATSDLRTAKGVSPSERAKERTHLPLLTTARYVTVAERRADGGKFAQAA
jgi:hypothetical protein